MSRHIFKCSGCGIYTMQENCTKCKKKTILPRPAKYSPEDKYSKYRRMAKHEGLKKSGLL